MRMEKGRLPRGPFPRRSIMGYTAGYLMFFVAGLIGSFVWPKAMLPVRW
jgi:hypothetical protein